MLEQRRTLTLDQALRAGELIAARLCRRTSRDRTLLIASFIGCRGEVDTAPVNEALLKQGHTLCFPAVDPACPGRMDFYFCRGSLIKNRWGIPEPRRQEECRVSAARIGLMLLPLTAFDLQGRRLGMGGGYYDRYIPALRPDCTLTGLAWDFQLANEVPSEPWDRRLDEVITPAREFVFAAAASP